MFPGLCHGLPPARQPSRAAMRSYGCRHSVGPSLLHNCVLELLLRYAEFRFLPAPKENFAIVFAAALHQVNCFWIEGVVLDADKCHGRTSLAAILPVRRAA